MNRRTPRKRALRFSVLAALLAVSAAPALAQDDDEDPDAAPRWLDLSLAGGVVFSSDWSDLVLLGIHSPGLGVFERVLLRDIAVSPGAAADAAVTYWRGRYGLRAHAAFSRSCLSIGPGCVEDVLTAEEREALDLPARAGRVETWLYDIAAVVGLRPDDADHRFRPYVLFGGAGVTYDPDAAIRHLLPSFIEFGGSPGFVRPDSTGDLVVVAGGGDVFLIAADEVGFETVLGGVLGIGADLVVPVGPAGIALRLEVTDHIIRSPLDVRAAALSRDFGPFFGFDDDDDLGTVEFDFGIVHNLRAVAGLSLRFPLRAPAGAARSVRAGRGS